MPRKRDEFGRVTPIEKYGKDFVERFTQGWEEACRRILGSERYEESRRAEETA